MKIHGVGSPGPVPAREETQPVRRPDLSQRDAAERVDVSNEARALSGRLREPEAPDMERVQRLRAALAEGRFVVDPDRIARAMTREEC